MNSKKGYVVITSFMNTLKRLFEKRNESGVQTAALYSDEQLLSWAQGCMLEGLPDDFYEARLDCERMLLADGKTELSVQHQFRLTATSNFERFSPADDLYPVQCIEKVLQCESWRKASLVFSPRKASFSWE